MTQEEAEALRVENALLRAEVAALRQTIAALQAQVAVLTEQLHKALVRIAELEQDKPEPPPYVKANRPPAVEPKGPRNKRAAEHNRSRKRATPTRIERHGLERCPGFNYRLNGESVDYTREVIVSAGVRAAGPAWGGLNASGAVEAIQERASGWWKAAEGKLYRAVDRYYPERYDRRAKPEPTPAPDDTPKPSNE